MLDDFADCLMSLKVTGFMGFNLAEAVVCIFDKLYQSKLLPLSDIIVDEIFSFNELSSGLGLPLLELN